MDPQEDLIFVEAPRNADHRTGVVSRVQPRTASRVGWAAPASAYTAAPAATMAYAPTPTMAYAPAASVYSAAPVYSPGPVYGSPYGQLGGLFGSLNIADLAKLAADAFAAFKALPAAPVMTGDVATDVANSDTHMRALAVDAQTRRQIEFGGEIAGRFSRGYGVW